MKNIWIILFVSCFWSCTQHRDFISSFPLHAELLPTDSIDLEELNILRPVSVVSLDSVFVFSNGRYEYNISVLDRNTHHLTNGVRTGEGPDEVISYIPVKNSRKNQFTYADRIRKKVFSLNYTDGKVTITEESALKDDKIPRLFCLAELNPKTLIGTGMFTDGRFIIYNKENDSYFYAGDYPENEEIKILPSLHKAALYNSSQICVHPNGKRFAVIYKGLLDIYEQISESEIRDISSNHFFFPKFVANDIGTAIVYDKGNIQGFLAISCDRTAIYLIYSDKTFDEGGGDIFSGEHIAVFDWEGRPMRIYHINQSIISLSVDKVSIWAISADYSFMYKYKLE